MNRRTVSIAIVLAIIATGIGVVVLTPAPNVGSHIHVEISNHPGDGFPIPRAPYTFKVVLRSHDNPGRITSFTLHDFGTVKKKIAVNLAPCDDCSLAFNFTVDFSTWPAGRHELRWHAKETDQDLELIGNQSQFTTSRSQICIETCLPNLSGRATPFQGGGSWYQNRGYQTVTLLSDETNVKPGGAIIVKASQDNLKQVCAFINPDFHNLSSGQTLDCWTNKRDHVVFIPGDANVGDRLVLYSTDGFNAGLFRMLLGDGTLRPITAYEYQSWWSKAGLILP